MSPVEAFVTGIKMDQANRSMFF